MKFALVSSAIPPAQSGQAMVIYHLLRSIDPDHYCLITQRNFQTYTQRGNCTSTLPGNYHFLQPEYQVTRGICRTASSLRWNLPLRSLLRIRVRQITRILKQEKCKAVVACTGDLFDPPAAYLASLSLGIPFFFYIFDDFQYQWIEPSQRAFSQYYEPLLVKGSKQFFVPNECMYYEYLRRYGVRGIVLHNPCDLSAYPAKEDENAGETRNEVKVVYTGAVYEAHYDAFRNLLDAIRLLGRPDLNLHIYTPQSPTKLKSNGISGAVVFHKHQPASRIPAIQRDADILFLPLAFNSPYQEVIRTASPGKTGELLAAGRPILVHAPKDSFVSWYFRKYQCGIVVDSNDPGQLREAIKQALMNPMLRSCLAAAARERAEKDFDLDKIQRIFLDTVTEPIKPCSI